MKRLAGPLITALIFLGIALILLMNLDLGSSTSSRAKLDVLPVPVGPSRGAETSTAKPAPPPAARPKPAGFREYPIGEEVERSKAGLRVAAVWLPTVEMEGQAHGGSDVIHLEADVKALENNPNGFALGEFIPYMKIDYEVLPAAGGPPIQKGELRPMIASDGLHYGASISMPKPGNFRLVYQIQPPSVGGLGRHVDPVSGVAPWWRPFEAGFDWDYPGPPSPDGK